MAKLTFVLNLILFSYHFQSTLSIWVDKDGGYRDLLVAVQKPTELTECGNFLTKIKDLTGLFSKHLFLSTEGRLHLDSVDVILDVGLARLCDVTTLGTNQKWTNADVRILDRGLPANDGSEAAQSSELIRVEQPQGCAEPGTVIEVESSLLDRFFDADDKKKSDEADKSTSENVLTEIGNDLVTSWAQYRWGVFGGLNPGSWTTSHTIGNHLLNQTRNCVNETSNCFPEGERNESAEEERTQTPLEFQPEDENLNNLQHLVCQKSVIEVIENHRDFSGRINKPSEDKRTLSATKVVSTLPTTTNTYTPPSKSTESAQASVKVDSNQDEILVSAKIEVSPSGRKRNRTARGVKLSEAVEDSHTASEASFIGVLPPVNNDRNRKRAMEIDNIAVEPFLGSLFGGIYNTKPSATISKIKSDKPPPTISNDTRDNVLVKKPSKPYVRPRNRNMATPLVRSKQLMKDDTYKASILNQLNGFQDPKVNFLSASKKTVIFALDLSSAAVAQASVDWLRGGLLRWMFGIGNGVNIGIIASYSNTSFTLSFGPIAPGPSTIRQLQDHMTLLPYQHEVDDDVYGGSYCLGCVIRESEKMLADAAVPLESALLILAVCEPVISHNQLKIASYSRIPIHTIALCPNSPLSIENLAAEQGNWALSQITMETGFASEVQLGRLATKITEESLLWPSDLRLQTIYEEEKLLRDEDVEKRGAYRRVRGSVSLPKGSQSQKLVILASSTPAKVVEIWIGNKKKEMIRDTTRRYWALLENHETSLSYSFKYLSTSLEIPLTVAIGVYERRGEEGLNIKLRTNMRFYDPMNPQSPYLKVWAIITKNGIPLPNADVTLSVTYMSGRTPSTYSLMMLDDGSTEPDMKSGDGIYSRYLTWTPGPGRYVLTAKVTESGTSLMGITDKIFKSTVDSSPISLILKSALPGDIFPPSRITSLSVELIENNLVNISWSAPGGDLDQGSAWRYQLKMYTGREALSKENFDSTGIDVYCIHGQKERAPMPAPALFGTPQYCITSIPFSNLNWYFAIRAIDGANNTGRISNIVSIFVYESTTTLPSKETKFKDGVQKVMMSTVIPTNNKLSDIDTSSWRLYGIALVCAVGLVMFIICLFACIICCRRARLRASKDPERPIYKIYVNNAYIQEEDREIKVVNKEKSIIEKDPTQWVNSLDKYSSVDASKEETVDSSGEGLEQHSPSSKYLKPIRFGVLTNGSIMREPPICSSSKPDDAVQDDYKYRDLSETISNSTTDGATGSTSSGATESTTIDQVPSKETQRTTSTFNGLSQMCDYDISYPPLGIPTLHNPSVAPVHTSKNDYHSDDEGGFRPRTTNFGKAQIPPKFSSFRYISPTEINSVPTRPVDYPPVYNNAKNQNTALPHGTVRSVKKRRHISFV